jgi:hypothetical protein
MMNCKGFGWKQSWPNFKTLHRHLPGGIEKNHKNLTQDSQALGPDLNLGPSEYEAGVLTTQPERLVNQSDKTRLLQQNKV